MGERRSGGEEWRVEGRVEKGAEWNERKGSKERELWRGDCA